MSRIGRAPIAVPGDVSIEFDNSAVTVTGPKGTLSQSLHPDITIELNDSILTVSRPTDSRRHRSLHGLTRALLNNMVTGVSKGFTKRLQVEGVGYRAEMDGQTLVLNVGYSHPIRVEPPENIEFSVDTRAKTIDVSGPDKQVVGELAAQIRKTRPPEPYKGKGIRYSDEVIRRKAGKAGKV